MTYVSCVCSRVCDCGLAARKEIKGISHHTCCLFVCVCVCVFVLMAVGVRVNVDNNTSMKTHSIQ